MAEIYGNIGRYVAARAIRVGSGNRRNVLYSKFGSKLTPISKCEDANGRITIQAQAEGAIDVRDYQIPDLKADDGSTEINDVIQRLPVKVIQDIPSARKRIADLPQNNRQQSPFRRRSN
jgi:hypothetical protein